MKTVEVCHIWMDDICKKAQEVNDWKSAYGLIHGNMGTVLRTTVPMLKSTAGIPDPSNRISDAKRKRGALRFPSSPFSFCIFAMGC